MKNILIIVMLMLLFGCTVGTRPEAKFKVGDKVKFVLNNEIIYVITEVKCNINASTCNYDLLDIDMQRTNRIQEDVLTGDRREYYDG